MKTDSNKEKESIKRSLNSAKVEKPAYGELYPLLEAIFLMQIRARERLRLNSPEISAQLAQTKWREGFPLLRRWDFPVACEAAEAVLTGMKEYIPQENQPLRAAHAALSESLANHAHQKEAFWQSFLQHDWEPWEEWIDTREIDIASLLFWTRSCLRPSLEHTARGLVERFSLPKEWLKGYCPICGSLPALLFLEGEGERKAFCSWCATKWELHRLQCPYCDNRHHESLGYLYIEAEPHYRIQYCRICKMYFKLIDTRERLNSVYLPLEEWATLHLDLLAQRTGWKQPPSPSPVVYGKD